MMNARMPSVAWLLRRTRLGVTGRLKNIAAPSVRPYADDLTPELAIERAAD
jgi:hypothetical protein